MIDDGTVTITELPNGRRSIFVTPRDPNLAVPYNNWETSYPTELIRFIQERLGATALCPIIAREEDPSYVKRLLENDLFAYFKPEDFAGKQILDFGCGSGASSIILARLFPGADITGVEMVSSSIAVARELVKHYEMPNIKILQSPSGSDLPLEMGRYDLVVMSAVFEHLLPVERKVLMPKIWHVVRDGGFLFINQTPNSLFPIESHTTMFPLINYLPDGLTHTLVRNFSKRTARTDTWEQMLRKGIRGASDREILEMLPKNLGRPGVMEPCYAGIKNRIDLYYRNTSPRLRTLKQIAKLVIRAVHRVSGATIVPDLSLVFRKDHAKPPAETSKHKA